MYRDIPLPRKIAFSIGFMGTQLFNASQTIATYWFWLEIMGLDPNAYSIIMLVVYNLWNALNDPIFGYISDRTRTRWGRRVIYIRIFAPLWWFFFALLYNPLAVAIQSHVGQVIWFTSLILLYDLCYTVVGNSYNSLLPELTTKTKERVTMNTLSNVFALVGYAAAFGLFPLMKKNLNYFTWYIIITGGLACAILFIPAMLIHERPIPDVEEADALSFWGSIKYCFKNRAYVMFIGFYFLQEASMSLINTNFSYYSTYVLGDTSFGTLLLIVMMAMTLPGFVIWSKTQNRVGTRVTLLIATCVFILSVSLLTFVRTPLLATIVTMLVGLGLSGALQFSYVWMAEAVDLDEIATNKRREASYYGTHAAITKWGIGVGQALLAQTRLITEFVKEEVDPLTGDILIQAQTSKAIWGIAIMMGVAPAFFKLLSLIFIYLSPLTQEKTAEIKTRLAEIHQKKFANVDTSDFAKI